MKNFYNAAYRLVTRSGKASAFCMAAYFASAGLYVLACRLMGLEGVNGGIDIIKNSPVKGFVAFLPGGIFDAWFAAGLTGRYTMDALTGAPEGMAYYANGWFLRKLAADSLFAGAMWVSVLFIIVMSLPSAVLAVAWLVVAAWLGLRIALWLNISVAENLGLIEAVKRSYALTRGQALRLLILGGIPRVFAWTLSWLMGKVLPGHAVLLYYIKALLDGATMVFVTGVVVAFYLELKTAGSKDALIEAVPAAAGPMAE